MAQPRDSQRFFDEVAGDWEAIRGRMYGTPLLDALVGSLDARPGMTALDVGAGSGFVTAGLLDAGLHVVALDSSDAMREEMERRFVGRAGLRLLSGDAERIPLPDGSVDRAAGNMFLHHTQEPARAIQELARVVRPGGVVALADLDRHGHESLRREHHDLWPGFDRDDVEQWMRDAGLRDVEVVSAPEACSSTDSAGGAVRVGVFIVKARRPG